MKQHLRKTAAFLVIAALVVTTLGTIMPTPAKASPFRQAGTWTFADVIAANDAIIAAGGIQVGGKPRFVVDRASESVGDYGSLTPNALLQKKNGGTSYKPDMSVFDTVASFDRPSPAMESLAPQALGQAPFTVFTRQNHVSSFGSSSIPPDTMGAVGPTQFVGAFNVAFTIQNKFTGANEFPPITLNALFADVYTPTPPDDTTLFDTRVRYDRLTQKWIIVAENYWEGVLGGSNRVFISIIDDPIITPTTVVRNYFYQPDLVQPTAAEETGCFYDYPTLGMDANALYMSLNVFDTCTPPNSVYFASTGFVIQKAPLFNNTASSQNLVTAGVITAFRDLTNGQYGFGAFDGLYTPQGADSWDPNSTVGYFIGLDFSDPNYQFTRLVMRTVNNPGSATPTLGPVQYINITPVNNPLTAPHLGNTGLRIDAGDGRLMQAVVRNGRLWTTHAAAVLPTGVGNGGFQNDTNLRDAAVFYEIDVTGAAPVLVQRGLQMDTAPTASNPVYYTYPSVMVSGQGHMAMGFSAVSAVTYAGAAYNGRLVSDPLGTLNGAAVIYQPGLDIYNTNAGGRKRWGDYSYTSLDPCDDMTMWTIQEYAAVRGANTGSGNWAMSVARLNAPAPTISDAAPAAITIGTSAQVTVTGTGWYNPAPENIDPTCPRSLIGAITGITGMAVTNVTYISPTQVLVTLDATGVSVGGTATLTLTNPDGQSASFPLSIVATTVGGTGTGTSGPGTGPIVLPSTGYAANDAGAALPYALAGVSGLILLAGVVIWSKRRR
ncbi:hypothetical protein ANRL4_04090 [Anaerolineae bacterium]|nr:hypothetical protein ANRL4_04090 [Anaerolineae bacterium]